MLKLDMKQQSVDNDLKLKRNKWIHARFLFIPLDDGCVSCCLVKFKHQVQILCFCFIFVLT